MNVIVTGIIDSNKGLLVSCIGKIRKATRKGISHYRNPYRTTSFTDFSIVINWFIP